VTNSLARTTCVKKKLFVLCLVSANIGVNVSQSAKNYNSNAFAEKAIGGNS
jgi:hypothetical protein